MRVPGIVSDTSDFALSKQQLRMLGGVFALFGVLELTGSFFIAHSITTSQAEASAQATARGEECKTRLTGLGYTATVDGDKISAEMNGLEDAAYKLGLASTAALSCQGWKLSRFCMGEGCGVKGGAKFELSPAKLSN